MPPVSLLDPTSPRAIAALQRLVEQITERNRALRERVRELEAENRSLKTARTVGEGLKRVKGKRPFKPDRS